MKNKSFPLVSVIIPTRDRHEMLIRAVKSVASQTYRNIEIIVVNDGAEYLDENQIRKEVNFQSFLVLRNRRAPGASGARNTGFLNSKGEFVGFLDDDDEWMPEKIEKQIEIFQNCDDRVGIVFTQHFIVKKGKKTRITCKIEGDVYEDLCKDHIPYNSSNPLIKRYVLNEVGFWDETFPAFQDVDLWLRIAKIYNFMTVEEPLVLFHSHGGKRITSSISKRVLGRYMMLRKHWADFPMKRKYLFIKRIVILDRATRRSL